VKGLAIRDVAERTGLAAGTESPASRNATARRSISTSSGE